ncbi:MAG TPA: hypothetical protein VF493_20700 [Terriglobales bacterium]
MSPVVALILIAITLGVFLAVLLAKDRASRRTLAELETSLTPVDAAALGNLLHEREDTFLRQNLGPREYRKIKRQRVRAAREYVWDILRNALVLSRIAGFALDSPDPQIQLTAQKLANEAVELRWSALLAYSLLILQEAYPNLDLSSIKIRERYTNLAESASWLYRLRFPESSIRINAALCG